MCLYVLSGKGLDRKTRFWLGFLFVVAMYSLPIAGFAYAGWAWPLALVLAAFTFSVYMVHRMTIKNVRLKYPVLSPEGHPDVYTGRMPRPIYEDMQRYPWFFKKKRNKKLDDKKVRKKK
jgi:hypothetical protein